MIAKTLRVIFRHFDDEIEGVIDYVGDAMTVKHERPELCKSYLEMAKAEEGHATALKNMACAEAKALGLDSEDADPVAKALWEDKKASMMKDLAKAHAYLEVYK